MTTHTRKSGAERREEIARAVLHIIGERGLTALTTEALAREIGVTSGALFRHFDSRDDMLREAVRYGLARIEGTFPDTAHPSLDRLLELARNRVILLGSDSGIAWLLRSNQAQLVLPEDAVELLSGVVKRSKRYLLEALVEGAAEGEIRTDVEPETLLVLVMGTIHAMVGMPGVHRLATGGDPGAPQSVLFGLRRLLSPAHEEVRAKPSGGTSG